MANKFMSVTLDGKNASGFGGKVDDLYADQSPSEPVEYLIKDGRLSFQPPQGEQGPQGELHLQFDGLSQSMPRSNRRSGSPAIPT